MSEIVFALLREHADMKKLFAALDRQVAIMDRGSDPNYDILQGIIDYCLTFPDLYHHPREDLVFAKLQLRKAGASEVLGALKTEHKELSDLTREFAAAVRNLVKGAEESRGAAHRLAGEFLDFYRRHIAMEEEFLFPVAIESLTPDDWKEIEAQLTASGDPLFGGKPEPRFEALRRNILEREQEELARR